MYVSYAPVLEILDPLDPLLTPNKFSFVVERLANFCFTFTTLFFFLFLSLVYCFFFLADSTKKNLEMRVEAENGATAGKTDLAKRAKALNLDAIHDTVHEMARDEARHGKAFAGLLKRYFGK